MLGAFLRAFWYALVQGLHLDMLRVNSGVQYSFLKQLAILAQESHCRESHRYIVFLKEMGSPNNYYYTWYEWRTNNKYYKKQGWTNDIVLAQEEDKAWGGQGSVLINKTGGELHVITVRYLKVRKKQYPMGMMLVKYAIVREVQFAMSTKENS